MKLNPFGHALRVARAQVGKTMMTMAEEIGTKPSFLSAMETGRSKIPDSWVEKIDQYLRKYKCPIENLKELADASNKSVSIENLPLTHQLLVSGFAKSTLDQEQLKAVADFFQALQQEGKQGDKNASRKK